MQRRFAAGGFLTFTPQRRRFCPETRDTAALTGGQWSMESAMNQVIAHMIDRAGWIFGLTTLFGLLASSGYLLFGGT
jgi:hypothetical protein